MTLYHSTGIIAASGGAAAKPGMVLLKPTSIAHSGTSASIGANGQVTFTAVTSLSLNGVFSATYDNYMVSISGNTSSGVQNLYYRLRASGTDASGSNYTWQYITVNGTTVTAGRSTETLMVQSGFGSTQGNGSTAFIYGPFLAQPTVFRSTCILNFSGAYLQDDAGTHSLSTSYDGVTIYPAAQNMTGKLAVYGIRS